MARKLIDANTSDNGIYSSRMNDNRGGILLKSEIENLIESGSIVFTGDKSQIQSASIDCSLGEHFWELVSYKKIDGKFVPIYKYFRHEIGKQIMVTSERPLLAVTKELCGVKRGVPIVPMLHSKSTTARMFLGTRGGGAGCGDPGYGSEEPWTMELFSLRSVTYFEVGQPIVQIQFHLGIGTGTYDGQYIVNNEKWTPINMIPKKFREYALYSERDF